MPHITASGLQAMMPATIGNSVRFAEQNVEKRHTVIQITGPSLWEMASMNVLMEIILSGPVVAAIAIPTERHALIPMSIMELATVQYIMHFAVHVEAGQIPVSV